MHALSELGTTVPAFLGKLWKLVEDPETDDLICWSPVSRTTEPTLFRCILTNFHAIRRRIRKTPRSALVSRLFDFRDNTSTWLHAVLNVLEIQHRTAIFVIFQPMFSADVSPLCNPIYRDFAALLYDDYDSQCHFNFMMQLSYLLSMPTCLLLTAAISIVSCTNYMQRLFAIVIAAALGTCHRNFIWQSILRTFFNLLLSGDRYYVHFAISCYLTIDVMYIFQFLAIWNLHLV